MHHFDSVRTVAVGDAREVDLLCRASPGDGGLLRALWLVLCWGWGELDGTDETGGEFGTDDGLIIVDNGRTRLG